MSHQNVLVLIASKPALIYETVKRTDLFIVKGEVKLEMCIY